MEFGEWVGRGAGRQGARGGGGLPSRAQAPLSPWSPTPSPLKARMVWGPRAKRPPRPKGFPRLWGSEALASSARAGLLGPRASRGQGLLGPGAPGAAAPSSKHAQRPLLHQGLG